MAFKIDNTEEMQKIQAKNLCIGDCITYKKLCEALKQPTYTGVQKKTQLNKFLNYFDYEKVGTKYLITDIYQKPIDVHKYPSHTIYTHLVEKILLNYLAKYKEYNYTAYITPIHLWNTLGMINENFLIYKNDYDKLLEVNNSLTHFEISDFYKRCKSRFYSILTASLKSLQNQRLIEYQYIYRIGIMPKEDIYDSNCFRDATDEETKIILNIEHTVLKELGLSNIQQINYSPLSRTFYQRLNTIYKDKYGWDNVYRFYKIIYNRDDVIEELSLDNLDAKKKELNDKIILALNQNAQNNYENKGLTSNYIQDLLAENHNQLPNKEFYYPETYVEKQEWLTDKLIKIKGE